MIRRRGATRRRYEMSLELFCVMAHGASAWERHWGGPVEAEAAFEALRQDHRLGVRPEQSYESWLAELENPAEDDDPEPDDDALPWENGR